MEEHLIQAIRRRFMRLSVSKRVSEIRAFMNKSTANSRLIRKAFPNITREVDSYREDSSASASSESTRPVALSAKPR